MLFYDNKINKILRIMQKARIKNEGTEKVLTFQIVLSTG